MHLCVYIAWLSGVCKGRSNAAFYRDPLLWALQSLGVQSRETPKFL